MATLNNEQKNLSKGEPVSFTLTNYLSSLPIKIRIKSTLVASITGNCGDNVSKPLFAQQQVYTITGNQADIAIETITNKCSAITAKLVCSKNNGQLVCTFDYTYQGQNFIRNDVTGSISVTEIFQEIPSYVIKYPACPSGYSYTVTRTSSIYGNSNEIIVSNPKSNGSATIYEGDSISMSASADIGYNTPSFGLNTVGTTNKRNINDDIQVIINSTGRISYPIILQPASGTIIKLKVFLYPPHPSTDCDGGCYCYCADGSRVDDGQDCPTIYGDYNDNKIYYGESIYVETSVPYEKFLDHVKVGNSTYNSTFFQVTANNDTIVNGQMVITSKLQPTSWRVVNSATHTFTGTMENISKTVSGIKAGRQTRITVSTGYYSTESYSTGAEQPVYCDGGCYCYCADGGRVDDGSLCGGWVTNYEYIKPGTHISNAAGTSIELAMSSNYAYANNRTVSVSANQLTFNGYKSGDSPGKYLVINKVEQYY